VKASLLIAHFVSFVVAHTPLLLSAMAGLTSSRTAAKAVRTTAKAAAKKWASLVPAKPAKAGHTSLAHKSTCKRPLPSVEEASSGEEAVVVKSVKKAHIGPEVEDEVVIEMEKEDAGESEDVEVDVGDAMEEEDVSADLCKKWNNAHHHHSGMTTASFQTS
jgi:hypothetical protein